jgi:hypothetical protein
VVAGRADVDTDPQLHGGRRRRVVFQVGRLHGSLLRPTRTPDHPPVSSTCRATIAGTSTPGDRHHPGRPCG